MSVEVARQVDVGLSNIPRRRFEAPGDIQLVTWRKIVKTVAVARRGQVGELVVRVAPRGDRLKGRRPYGNGPLTPSARERLHHVATQ